MKIIEILGTLSLFICLTAFAENTKLTKNVVLELQRKYDQNSFMTYVEYGGNRVYLDHISCWEGDFVWRYLSLNKATTCSFVTRMRDFSYLGENEGGYSLSTDERIEPDSVFFREVDVKSTKDEKGFVNKHIVGGASFGHICMNFPVDSDKDGLPDADEREKYHCSPARPDSDFDGILDGDEVECGTHPYLWDTDGDGLGDADDPEPLAPYMRKNYDEWARHWSNVLVRMGKSDADFSELVGASGDYDRDGLSNYQEFQNGTSPIWRKGEFDAMFTPGKMVCMPPVTEQQKVDFAVTVCSHGAVTGLVCLSSGKFNVSLNCKHIQDGFYPDISAPADCYCIPFIARYGVPLEFELTFDDVAAADKYEADVFLLSSLGQAPSMLRAYSSESAEAEMAQYPPPTLESPALGEVIDGRPVALRWNGSYPKMVDFKLVLTPLSGTGEAVEYNVGQDTHKELPLAETCRYRWEVIVLNTKTKKEVVRSQAGEFVYLAPDGKADSDGDGYSDNEEFMAGTNPADGQDFPLSIDVDTMPCKSRVDSYFSSYLCIRGGHRPYYCYPNMSVPDGLSIDTDGLISGVPEKVGMYDLGVVVFDKDGRSAKATWKLLVQPEQEAQVEIHAGGLEKAVK